MTTTSLDGARSAETWEQRDDGGAHGGNEAYPPCAERVNRSGETGAVARDVRLPRHPEGGEIT